MNSIQAPIVLDVKTSPRKIRQAITRIPLSIDFLSILQLLLESLENLPSPQIFLRRRLPFFHGKNAVDARYGDALLLSTGPMNLDGIHRSRLPQPEVHPLVRARTVRSPAIHVRTLPNSACR